MREARQGMRITLKTQKHFLLHCVRHETRRRGAAPIEVVQDDKQSAAAQQSSALRATLINYTSVK